MAQQGRNADAVPQFEAVLRLTPADAQAHDNLGGALMAIGRVADAMDEFEAALRLQPDNAIAHYNRGVALRALGRPEEHQAALAEADGLAAGFADPAGRPALKSAARLPPPQVRVPIRDVGRSASEQAITTEGTENKGVGRPARSMQLMANLVLPS